MRTAKDVEQTCKKLKPVIGERADELWYMYLAEDEKGRKNVALDIEIIAEKILKKDALTKQKVLLEPPDVTASDGSFHLGDIFYNDKKYQPLYLKPEDFTKQVGIFAVTGEGKTNLAYHLALQLLKSKTPFMVIDWKRSWRNLLSLKDKHPELKKVQVYTIGRDVLPFLWNPFRQPPGSDKELWVSTISDVLEKSHLSGPGVAHYCNKVYSKLLKSADNNFYPNFYDGLKELNNIKAYERELRWKQTALRIFSSFTMGNASKAFNERDPIRLEDLLDKPVILELDLEMPKPLRVFLSEMILRWIHLYRLSQGETDKLRHVLFLEEVHNLFAQTGFYKQADSLENIYREIRAFGQGIVSITQHPSMLPIYLLGNCHTQIYLGLQHADDIRAARKSLFLSYDEESYPNILNVGECIIKIKNRVEPCLVKTPLVPVKKGMINDEWLKEHNLSRLFWKHVWNNDSTNPNYLHLKNKVSDILAGNNYQLSENTPTKNELNTPGYLKPRFTSNTRYSGFKKANKILKGGILLADNIRDEKVKYPTKIKPHQKLLIDIFKNPLSSTTRRYKRLVINPYYGNVYRKQLINEKCIVARKIITRTGWITLYEVTQKGRMVLMDLGYELNATREGVIHLFWKTKISQYYKNMNLKVLIEEYYVNGRPDIIVEKDNKKTAIEIETGKSDYILNVEKCLDAGFDEVISVATNKYAEQKIRNELESKGIVDDRVKVTNVFGFDVV